MSLPVAVLKGRMRVGFYQFDPQFGEVGKNLDRIVARLE